MRISERTPKPTIKAVVFLGMDFFLFTEDFWLLQFPKSMQIHETCFIELGKW